MHSAAMDPASMDKAARALAEPTRREILRLVQTDELTASAIADNFSVSRPAISQHLRVLQDAELVVVRAEGTRRWYRARPEGFVELRAWLDSFWADGLQTLKAQVEADQLSPNLPIQDQPPQEKDQP